ncbi:hypothetical protein BA917_01445 [Helicobacter pullorum]|uniref:hypothetical protein n=1 Tax=Helicobacter pullorum TaxID=35818 RepID=UPI0008169955|nr:hypothetical protein [Helicobacter pullorum]OCR21242.1 hypothetical protein BA917_01445 [Helicobacter pullorum]
MRFSSNPKKSFASNLKKGNIVVYFFLFLMIFSILMVLSLSHYQESKRQMNANVSRFEMLDFEYYKISPLGVETFVIGKNAREIGKDAGQLEHINVTHYLFDESTKEFLQSSLAFYDGTKVIFPNGINYSRDSIKFWSEQANYYPDSKEILGQGDFMIFSDNYNIKGKNILYKNGKIYAKNIDGNLKTDKK